MKKISFIDRLIPSLLRKKSLNKRFVFFPVLFFCLTTSSASESLFAAIPLPKKNSPGALKDEEKSSHFLLIENRVLKQKTKELAQELLEAQHRLHELKLMWFPHTVGPAEEEVKAFISQLAEKESQNGALEESIRALTTQLNERKQEAQRLENSLRNLTDRLETQRIAHVVRQKEQNEQRDALIHAIAEAKEQGDFVAFQLKATLERLEENLSQEKRLNNDLTKKLSLYRQSLRDQIDQAHVFAIALSINERERKKNDRFLSDLEEVRQTTLRGHEEKWQEAMAEQVRRQSLFEQIRQQNRELNSELRRHLQHIDALSVSLALKNGEQGALLSFLEGEKRAHATHKEESLALLVQEKKEKESLLQRLAYLEDAQERLATAQRGLETLYAKASSLEEEGDFQQALLAFSQQRLEERQKERISEREEALRQTQDLLAEIASIRQHQRHIERWNAESEEAKNNQLADLLGYLLFKERLEQKRASQEQRQREGLLTRLTEKEQTLHKALTKGSSLEEEALFHHTLLALSQNQLEQRHASMLASEKEASTKTEILSKRLAVNEQRAKHLQRLNENIYLEKNGQLADLLDYLTLQDQREKEARQQWGSFHKQVESERISLSQEKEQWRRRFEEEKEKTLHLENLLSHLTAKQQTALNEMSGLQVEYERLSREKEEAERALRQEKIKGDRQTLLLKQMEDALNAQKSAEKEKAPAEIAQKESFEDSQPHRGDIKSLLNASSFFKPFLKAKFLSKRD